ncbi:MAG: 16S rRNA (adenine(1518)-N(6)/adenine(1519)-N(6))-dimethyltransferase RsmA [Bacteroidales bacterium]|nr:16S rRNA (adenine(1518)-N(6)/adenine(1519)-N(6))-dimethyltransferase RsmA [Bacteroidales bacterium]
MAYQAPKKSLGQHFLKDHNIAKKIVCSISPGSKNILEVGPGKGILTRFLAEKNNINLKLVEIDKAYVDLLRQKYPAVSEVIHDDFLKLDLKHVFEGKFNIIGNFPYHISSQIFFRILENRDTINEIIGMVQKEVALRITSPPGNKTYGILSVLLQAYYNIEFLFTVNPAVFEPPPKVKSAVIRLKRNSLVKLPCNESVFMLLVKTCFNQRRKMLRNSLKNAFPEMDYNEKIYQKRPEQLSVNDFVYLAASIERTRNN